MYFRPEQYGGCRPRQTAEIHTGGHTRGDKKKELTNGGGRSDTN